MFGSIFTLGILRDDGRRRRKPVRQRALAVETLEARTVPSFVAPSSFHFSRAPGSVAVADFNHDGNQDLVVADDSNAATLTVLLGNGDGSFRTAASFPSPFGLVSALGVGDFNGDGILDIAVGSSGQRVGILLGNGDGTFRSAGAFSLGGDPGAEPQAIVVADFNRDGGQDLVVASAVEGSPEPLVELLGNGDGSFKSPVNLGVSGNVVVAGDLNNDGRPDLVVGGTGSAVVLPGNGDGTFQAPLPFAPRAPLAVTDVNGDGIPDLIFTTHTGISERLGNGNGTFQGPVRLTLPANTPGTILGVGDFNNDGLLDVVIKNQPFTGQSQALSVLLNNGAGSFVAAPTFAAGPFPHVVVAGDFTGDGLADLVTAAQDGTHLLVNNGDGTFQSVPLSSIPLGGLVVGDFNGDGQLDFAGFAGGIDSDLLVNVFLGNGDGTFQAPEIFDLGPNILASASLVARDFDGDGRLDLAVLDETRDGNHSFVTVLLGNGDGTFRAAETHQVAAGQNTVPEGLVAGDFTGHGHLDLLATSRDGTLVELAGNGDGTFQDPVTFHTAARPIDVAVGDFRGNGILDLIVTDSGGAGIGSSVSVLLGNGDGTFGAPVTYQVGVDPAAVVVGDFNGDGIADVAVANSLSNSVSVLFGNGDGAFRNAVDYLVGIDPRSLVAADFNGDGALDLATANFHSNDVSVLLNGNDASSAAARVAAVDPLFSGARADSVSASALGQQPSTTAVAAAFSGALPEAVSPPRAEHATADAANVIHHHEQEPATAFDIAELTDALSWKP
jgi:hypothetical protein